MFVNFIYASFNLIVGPEISREGGRVNYGPGVWVSRPSMTPWAKERED